MWDVQACLVCLKTKGKLYNMDNSLLRRYYNAFTGIKISKEEGFPSYLCVECSAMIVKFQKFRNKCHKAYFVLQELKAVNKEITEVAIETLDCAKLGLGPLLSYLQLEKVVNHAVKFQWANDCRDSGITGAIPVLHISTTEENPKSEVFNSESNNVIIPGTSKSDDCIKPKVENDNETDGISINENDGISDNEYNNAELEPTEEIVEDESLNLCEDNADRIPISENEAKAAFEINNLLMTLKYPCSICKESYLKRRTLKAHENKHDKIISGKHFCEICNTYYRTYLLLEKHHREKHKYKYVCKSCPEVNFSRTTASKHFMKKHYTDDKKANKGVAQYESSFNTLLSKSKKKPSTKFRGKELQAEHLNEIILILPVSHEEQYKIVEERKNSKNFKASLFKCSLCFKGFREQKTFRTHLNKHDPSISGELQCDVCKMHFPTQRKMYRHMRSTHVIKYSCRLCDFIVYNRNQAIIHYKFHKDVIYTCQFCQQEFKKVSTMLTHVRVKHPSMYICNLCGHSFVSENGLVCHKQIKHTDVEKALSETIQADASHPLYCRECCVQFVSELAYKVHMGSSSKHVSVNISSKPNRTKVKRRNSGTQKKESMRKSNENIVNNGVSTDTECEVCGILLHGDVATKRHYQSMHPGYQCLKRYMCDVCGHTTQQYGNLLVHLRTHTQEKPYECPHCERRFSMPGNRDRHIFVHTGEKRYQCPHCNRRFTQRNAVKLHIQTVHLKIPYGPWKKANRRRKQKPDQFILPDLMQTEPCLPAASEPKADVENQIINVDYLNAYISYND